jgi:hypothetical protein
VKNDERDAKDLAAMLRLGRLAEGWIAPPETRELRELVRYRFHLVGHRTSAKTQIHRVMAKNGVLPVRKDMWGPGGTAQLDSLDLPAATPSASSPCETCSRSTTERSTCSMSASTASSRTTPATRPS